MGVYIYVCVWLYPYIYFFVSYPLCMVCVHRLFTFVSLLVILFLCTFSLGIFSIVGRPSKQRLVLVRWLTGFHIFPNYMKFVWGFPPRLLQPRMLSLSLPFLFRGWSPIVLCPRTFLFIRTFWDRTLWPVFPRARWDLVTIHSNFHSPIRFFLMPLCFPSVTRFLGGFFQHFL